MNAIILAAGLGTRLRPLTNEIPKCLVEVNGEPIIERQIKFLLKSNIQEIILVGGYKAEKLAYLKQKYGVRIILNPIYDKLNNFYSLYIARSYFNNSYILEGDIFIKDNCFIENLNHSCYFSPFREYKNEWGLSVNHNNILQKIIIGSGTGFFMSGVSYWAHSDCEIIKKRFDEIFEKEDYSDLFWDNAVIDVLNTLSPIKVIRTDCIHEIDTKEDLERIACLAR